MERIDLDHHQTNACTFALIDPLHGNEAALAAWANFPQTSLVPMGFEAKAAQLPRLVDLRKISNGLRDRMLDLLLSRAPTAGGALCVGLFETRANVEHMALHLCTRLAPHFPQDQPGIFRFYDPVVFEHLIWTLQTPLLASLFGPVNAWILPLRGAWYTQVPPTDDATLRSLSFHLNAASWQRVFRIGAIHGVLDNDPAWRSAPATFGPQVEPLLIRAAEHQLAERDDAVAFATHGLRWHRNFDHHPRVAALLADCVGHPARYRRLTSGWSDAEWQTITAELERPRIAPSHPATTDRLSQGAC